jgi:hypothetical protein
MTRRTTSGRSSRRRLVGREGADWIQVCEERGAGLVSRPAKGRRISPRLRIRTRSLQPGCVDAQVTSGKHARSLRSGHSIPNWSPMRCRFLGERPRRVQDALAGLRPGGARVRQVAAAASVQITQTTAISARRAATVGRSFARRSLQSPRSFDARPSWMRSSRIPRSVNSATQAPRSSRNGRLDCSLIRYRLPQTPRGRVHFWLLPP